MSRLVFVWGAPYHLSAEQADAWVQEEIGRLLAGEEVQTAELSRLRNASSRHGREGDWMLVLDLAPGVDGREWVDRKACTDWLLDLRQLGLRPSVVLAEPTRQWPQG